MTAGALHGELSGDGSTIILRSAGASAWTHQRIAALVSKLTATLKETGTGAMTVPCTWANVVQIGWTFRSLPDLAWVPGERLRYWMAQQAAIRYGPLPELERSWPEGMTPRNYQIEGARWLARAGKFMLLDDMGPQPESTPVWTPGGWAELGSLAPGDLVYDSDGQPTRVRSVKHFGEQLVWRVTFSDRSSTLATGSHRWHVFTVNDRARDTGGRVLTTDQIKQAGLRDAAGNRKFFLPQQPVIRDGDDSGLTLEPYAYGALLGDGSLSGRHISITCPDDSILQAVTEAAKDLGTSWRWDVPGDRCQFVVFHSNGMLARILNDLNACKLSGEKAVSPRYLGATSRVRRAVLAGLLDTDGSVAAGCVEFSSASKQLSADVAFLARSLGAVVTESDPQPAGYKNGDGEHVACQDKHRLHMRFPASGPNPFRVERKAEAWATQSARLQRQRPPRLIESIEPAGQAPVCCIEMAATSTRVYLTDTALIPTHNTGKTVQTILGIEQRRRTGIEVFPLLIIVPGWVVADSWEQEIAAWAPHWPKPQVYATPGRTALLSERSQVLLTTYATAALDAPSVDGPLARYRPASVVLDEAQMVQNADAVRTKAAERICKHAQTTVELSGTLFTQDTGGSFAPLKCLDPGTWQDKQRYKDRFLLTRKTEYAEKITGLNPVTEPEFRACLDGQMLRRTKAQVLPELPPKVYTVLRPEIPPEWRAAYDQLRDDMLASLPDGGELPVFDTLTQLTRLSQLASSAADVEWAEEWDERLGMFAKKPVVTLRAPSWKAEVLMGIMERRTAPVAVFTASRQLAEITGRDYLEKAGYRTGYILGIGKGITQGSRKRDIAAFQAGELDAIVCTAKAGGVGITLTAADTVVFLQRDYEFDKSIQPEDRAHRYGQLADKVQIIDVVAKGTVDERARELIHEKGSRWAEFARDVEFMKTLLGGKR